jgi:Protein of unknown function (DUF3086)
MNSSDNSNSINEENPENKTLNHQENEVEKKAESVKIDNNQKTELATKQIDGLKSTITKLQAKKTDLETEIKQLQEQKNNLLSAQIQQVETTLNRLVQESVNELEQRKQTLQISIEQLERRKERLDEEMRTTFAGVSQDLAIRVQGFKDYLVGSLQDLAAAAEQLELPSMDDWESEERPTSPIVTEEQPLIPKFSEQSFEVQQRQIKTILDQYRTLPDYYGPPWQLRRTFEPIHAERVQNWFFSQGGRGVIKNMGSRLQNILVASATISVLDKLYGDRLKTLILANTPERLGEWRRGLQDCLGISRSDFGPDRGVVLFDNSDAVEQRAERLVAQRQLPLIIIDETEEQIELSLLQFPLWLAFTPDPNQAANYDF